MSKYTDFECYRDEIIPIYQRVGDQPFTHKDIADLATNSTIPRCAARDYIVPLRDKDGRFVRVGRGSKVWQFHPRAAARCRRAIAQQAQDHRYENLAAGLTGGSECA